ncbi:hypothetical protein [Cerasicoccus arenae]|nr:hypothetical protein [Cerasicoccus arenae]MBK1859776.1 hypothetical protein [Cerasicoccus arenae]
MAADWIGVDDFDSHQDGSSTSTKRAWMDIRNFEPATVTTLPDGNQVAQIAPGQALASSTRAQSLMIPEGASGVIFLKFRTLKDSRYWGGVFGMASKTIVSESDIAAAWTLGNPKQGSRPNATLAVLSPDDDQVLVNNRGRMNKAYEVMPEIKPDVWYSLWVTVDNSHDEVRMYIQGGDFEKRTELTDFRDDKKNAFQFQTASASDLTHFVVINPTDPEDHNPRTIQIDEINFYVEAMPSAVAGR